MQFIVLWILWTSLISRVFSYKMNSIHLNVPYFDYADTQYTTHDCIVLIVSRLSVLVLSHLLYAEWCTMFVFPVDCNIKNFFSSLLYFTSMQHTAVHVTAFYLIRRGVSLAFQSVPAVWTYSTPNNFISWLPWPYLHHGLHSAFSLNN